MLVTLEELYWLCAGLLLFIGYGLALIAYQKYRLHRRKKQQLTLNRNLLQGFAYYDDETLLPWIHKAKRRAFDLLQDLTQLHQLHKDPRNRFVKALRETDVERRYHQQLRSSFAARRRKAALLLAALPCSNTNHALEEALPKEQDLQTKLYLCAALARLEDVKAIPLMVETLPGAPQWYRTRVNMRLASFGKAFHDYVPQLTKRTEMEIQSLLVDFAAIYPSAALKKYLLQCIASPIKDIAYRATRNLGIFYCHELKTPLFLENPDPVIRNITIQALSSIPTVRTLELLLPLLAQPRHSDQAASAMSSIVQKKPFLLNFILEEFQKEHDASTQNALATVLANRLEYLLMRLTAGPDPVLDRTLTCLIQAKKTNAIIGLLRRNHSQEIELILLRHLRRLLPELPDVRQELRLYLPADILNKLGETPLPQATTRREHIVDHEKIFYLRLLLPFAFLSVPLLYAARYWEQFYEWTPYMHLSQFVLDFNYYIAFYSLAVNGISLAMLFFSLLAIRKQGDAWNTKKRSFLFRPRILPGITIIAPAYQEESTIIESTRSLLNLHYPNYELIVVNDGSNDKTLDQLIEHFQLEKIDRFVPQRLKTQPIRGLYASKAIPKLLVVDKANGGKADALNAGINLSGKEFFCGIDADCLLEKDSLIKLASTILDAPEEPVAVGGNIFPVNGCKVDRGELTHIGLPASHLARFQTIEYLRAFMAGRLGWAQINSLLIISGAFGLFNKDRVVEIGGYLTSSERYKKDTVGEDMELVVRLRRHMCEQNKPHSILYAFNANCWTEVPEPLSVLHRQRDRWQRGLIDILFFHRKLLLNPRYGRLGMVALPYFFLFEMFGPFLEVQGYVMVVAAACLGLLNLPLALLLLLSSVLLGVLVSVFSLVIVSRENDYFPGPYMATLLGYAILENFWFRQLANFWRVTGYLNTLRQQTGWGNMKRQGFQQSEKPAEQEGAGKK